MTWDWFLSGASFMSMGVLIHLAHEKRLKNPLRYEIAWLPSFLTWLLLLIGYTCMAVYYLQVNP